MKNKILLLIAIAPAILYSCKPTPCADVLFKKDTTAESERKNTLFAFVGEKIELTRIPYEDDSNFFNFHVKYKVLQRVYGCYPGDTIEFHVNYHHQWPQFSKYKTVLLYLSKENDEYVAEDDIYNDVYMTRSGKWAGPWLSDDEQGYDSTGIVPQPMDFVQKVAYPLSDTMNIGFVGYTQFPHPFFWTVGDSAIAQYGSYIEDIFKVKKKGPLYLKGWFGVSERELARRAQVQDVELEVVHVKPEELPPATFEETEERFKSFWNHLEESIEKSATFPVQDLLLDSFWVCGSLFTKQKFMQGCNLQFFDSSFYTSWDRWAEVHECEPFNLPDLLPNARKRIIKEKDGYGSIRLRLIASKYFDLWREFTLGFIETKQGFKIHDIRFTNKWSCCF